jgi:hypothetical protein
MTNMDMRRKHRRAPASMPALLVFHVIAGCLGDTASFRCGPGLDFTSGTTGSTCKADR